MPRSRLLSRGQSLYWFRRDLRRRFTGWVGARSPLLAFGLTLYLGARARAKVGTVVFSQELAPGEKLLITQLPPPAKSRRRR
ncbi:MAG: hypothetical protein IPM45_01250 [Acidimicrobiales bacterium]|nr:hypothetical protein [Acidimicrobiales bacterium]